MTDGTHGPDGLDPDGEDPNAQETFAYRWPEGETAPTGWYYADGDPPDTERYWNGTSWEGEPVSVYGATPARRPMPAPPPVNAGPVPPAVPYAPWIYRLGGLIVDAILISILTIPMQLASPSDFDSPLDIPSPMHPLAFLAAIDGLIGTLVTLITFVGIAWVWAWSPGETGQTPGKRLVGISIVDDNTHQPIGHTKHIFRTLAAYLNSIVCYLGWLWPLWDDKNQTLADKAVGSVVITSQKGPIWPLVPTSPPATPGNDGLQDPV